MDKTEDFLVKSHRLDELLEKWSLDARWKFFKWTMVISGSLGLGFAVMIVLVAAAIAVARSLVSVV